MNNRLYSLIRYSILLIPLLVLFTGCLSLKKIPASKISSIPQGKRVFFFHTADTVRIVYPVTGENGQFAAIVVRKENMTDTRLRQVHIYAGPPSAIKIEGDKLICPIGNIAKVENYRISAGTIIGAAGILLLLFTLPIYL